MNRSVLAPAAALTLVACANLSGLSGPDAGVEAGHGADATRHDSMAGSGSGSGSHSGSGSSASRDAGSEDAGEEAGEDACDIGGQRHNAGAPDPMSACLGCHPATDPEDWTPDDDGTKCNDAGAICHNGNCVQGCEIAQVFYGANRNNPNNVKCQFCDPAVNTAGWTNRDAGTPCGGGQTCSNGTCGSRCVIDDSGVPSGMANPENPCQLCEPGVSLNAWTSAANGTQCGDAGEICVSASASCVKACYIAGTFYDGGTIDPSNTCLYCAEATSTSEWTIEPPSVACQLGNGNEGACGPDAGCRPTSSFGAH